MWKNISINSNQIKAQTEKAILVNCPHNSNYDGYSFWHPSKLVRSGKHCASVSIGYTDEFEFKLIKYGKGKWNSRNIIDEVQILAQEFEEMFDIQNKNITSKIFKNEYETHKPMEAKPVENNLKVELLDE